MALIRDSWLCLLTFRCSVVRPGQGNWNPSPRFIRLWLYGERYIGIKNDKTGILSVEAIEKLDSQSKLDFAVAFNSKKEKSWRSKAENSTSQSYRISRTG